ncbi:hypothetical protein BC937DRAFT_87792 [Endogone sp. FLAS-F59071]|nr:hypothetical protein BC937DRAFT_87792 [Endogone sp. FLAS-F59071]|eukprot:RUS19236.1 hypothetical protein BC937DRAFT_87792 [Endogone sp. FLAS-F59071]
MLEPRRKADMSDGDVVEDNVETQGAPCEVLAHEAGNTLTLRDELRGVELRNYGLEYLVHNRGENTLVVVLAQGPVDGREGVDVRLGKDTAGDINHLKVFAVTCLVVDSVVQLVSIAI